MRNRKSWKKLVVPSDSFATFMVAFADRNILSASHGLWFMLSYLQTELPDQKSASRDACL